MNQTITANELKTRGVAALNDLSSSDQEIFVSVRGKNKFVILPIEKYNYLRECELDTALNEARADIKNGKFNKDSIEKHIKRISRG